MLGSVPSVRLAGTNTHGLEIASFLESLGASVISSPREDALSEEARIGADPLFVDTYGAPLDPRELRKLELFAREANAGPITVILDKACIDRSAPILDIPNLDVLVWPAERETVMRMLKSLEPSGLVGDYDGGDHFDLQKLRDELGQITEKLSQLVHGGADAAPAATARSHAESAAAFRRLIRQRRVRASFFPSDLFADPAWDILLDLAAARHENKAVSISSLCIAASVPTTTGLRWIKGMTEAGLLQRTPDPEDARRSFVTLSDTTARQMDAYLDAID